MIEQDDDEQSEDEEGDADLCTHATLARGRGKAALLRRVLRGIGGRVRAFPTCFGRIGHGSLQFSIQHTLSPMSLAVF